VELGLRSSKSVVSLSMMNVACFMKVSAPRTRSLGCKLALFMAHMSMIVHVWLE